MHNYIQESDSIGVIAPAGGVIGGQLYQQGSLVGIVASTEDEGEEFMLVIEGAFDSVPKKAGEAWTVGNMLYYETSSSSLTTTATSNTWAGYAFYAAASDATAGAILLKH